MADKDKKSINLLPEYFRTDKNSKFLSSTLDQLIQAPQLERIDGYVGSKITPTYDSERDFYITDNNTVRQQYPLEPALVFRDKQSQIQDVIGYDDIINEIKVQGGNNKNLDRLFRTKFYSFDPLIDWDKFVNYDQYYWLPEGPPPILINQPLLDVEDEIVGQSEYLMPNGYYLSNGMVLTFSNDVLPASYNNKIFIVEGVGTAISLVDFASLQPYEQIVSIFDERFDSTNFDTYPFDNDKKLPLIPEYITINKSSLDLNPWSRYNRWFHVEIIKVAAEINKLVPYYPSNLRALRPIIEFKPNIQLYNFGKRGIKNIDLIDTVTQDAFSKIQGSYGYYIDGILIEEGHRVIFNVDVSDDVRSKIYRVHYDLSVDPPIVNLVEDQTPDNLDVAPINYGEVNSGSSWYYNSSLRVWTQAQTHTSINQPPLFDLFDGSGNSYSDRDYYQTNFYGNQLFGYSVGQGVKDKVLGFPLKYQNSVGTGSYLFKNYFAADTILVTENNVSYSVPTGTTFLRINGNQDSFSNIWREGSEYQIPVVELQILENETDLIVVTCLDKPFSTVTNLVSYVNNKKVPCTLTQSSEYITVSYDSLLSKNDTVVLKIFTDQIPNANGSYETPLSLTNNPLNGPISEITLSEMSDHLSSMLEGFTALEGQFPGSSNLRDLDNYQENGRRLIISKNPISFAQTFLGKKEHNVVDAIRKVADHYNQFKSNLIRLTSTVEGDISPADALDQILLEINKSKNLQSPYYSSDMLGYGKNKVVTEFTVDDTTITEYPIGIDFDLSTLSTVSVLIYLNNEQVTVGKEYEFNLLNSSIIFSQELAFGDKIKIVRYIDTLGSFVPPTPSKVGLFPKYQPEIYLDNSYIENTVSMIRCHDGSVIRAYDDYRDNIILEFEKRIFNNIKTTYNPNIFDIGLVLPGAFRTNKYDISDVNNIIQKDFIKWAGNYNIDVTTNNSYDEGNSFTWNYKGGTDILFENPTSGYWKNFYRYFYDTDQPNVRPWEMLGLSSKPVWWNSEYGTNYSSTNTVMWSDIENGFIRDGTNTYKDAYARPGLSTVLPVDQNGNLVSPVNFMIGPIAYNDQKSNWIFGDCSPAETSWRNSSYWPFVINAAAALLDPTNYTSKLFDLSRISFNPSGQIVYSDSGIYLNPKNLVTSDSGSISGFGVFVQEVGMTKDLNYISILRQDLDYVNYNLFHKLGGFTNKEKLQIIIDSIDPTSTGPGAYLPPEDYSLLLNVSNPIKSSRISGIIVQKTNGQYVVKGYDNTYPYFTIFKPIKTLVSGAITVGGISASYTDWTSSTTDTVIGGNSTTTRYYKQGQIVKYNGKFYRVKVGHNLQAIFDPDLFEGLPSLPITGGVTVQLPARYELTETLIPYGTVFSTEQEVFDLILGYGNWLESQGFIFDQFQNDLGDVINWKFSGKEFLYWTTQNWANNNLITLSPFADLLKMKFQDSVVDSLTSKKYEYSLLKADGRAFPVDKFDVNRDSGTFTISTYETEEGIFFASLNLIQKEHAMVFNNETVFNDTIYDIETGYKQRRLRLSGFRTKNWDGDFFSPGFVYDNISISDWKQFVSYAPGDVVRYNGFYYQANEEIRSNSTFDYNKWVKLTEKPQSDLLPNFDYKIGQFEDFYSLDIDNFDYEQQKLAQHLIGYSEREFLRNIFVTPTARYKFYRGYIKEKGTKNSIDKLAKANKYNNQGDVEINESWAFRVGHYGGYETYNEIEFKLQEAGFLENPYIVKFVDVLPSEQNPLINYVEADALQITPARYSSTSTFKTVDGVFDDNNIELTTAGYVRREDVTATAYNKNSILDIANNNLINEGDTFWLGFLENGDWTVYRYTLQTPRVTGVFINVPGEELAFVTNYHHQLAIGDIVSIIRFNDQVNGIYRVIKILKANQFVVASDLSGLEDDDLLYYGALFKFEPVRYENLNVFSQQKNLFRLFNTEKVWIDSGVGNKWQVYEKVKNYNTALEISSSQRTPGQKLGHAIYSTNDSSVLLTSAYDWYQTGAPSYGKVWVYDKDGDNIEKQYEYTLNTGLIRYCANNTSTQFGYSLAYDVGKKLYFSGAPESSFVRAANTSGAVALSTGSGNIRYYISDGLVKISSRNIRFNEENTQAVIANPYSANYARFGHSIYINQVAANQPTLLLVGSPATYPSSATGSVYAYNVNTQTNTSTILISAHPRGITLGTTSSISLTYSSKWGHKISGSKTGDVIAISAPGHNLSTATGILQIYDGALNWKQTIISPFGTTDQFGDDVVVSSTGKYLIASSKEVRFAEESRGKAAVYVNTGTGIFTYKQLIENPLVNSDLKFGHAIAISEDETTLAISSLGTNRSQFLTFDSNGKNGETTFDQKTTRFVDPVPDSGAAYVYNLLDEYFIQAEELNDADILRGSRYGTAVSIVNNNIFVGSPSFIPVGVKFLRLTGTGTVTVNVTATISVDFSAPILSPGAEPTVEILYSEITDETKTVSGFTVITPGYGYLETPTAALVDQDSNVLNQLTVTTDNNSRLYQFKKINTDLISWQLLREQEPLTDPGIVTRVALIDSVKEEITDYLDVIDPVKGKLAGVAEQELTYRVVSDPAVYTIGIGGVIVDDQVSWIDDHVGELWWDLSSAKYVWYEQGDEIYRKNNWGKLFPGSTIDVYEWVKSDLLPSEWAAQADTTIGLTDGISGQPKYPDNTVLSVKQVYNSSTGGFENVYYYWVKNKVIVPNVANRRISSYQVSSIIADPTANGIKYASILSADAVAFSNVQPQLISDKINANIALDTSSIDVPRHTEWLLLEEGDPYSIPSTLLEKKLIDSLLGHDSLGNLVPNPSLTDRNRYGISIRPQQTLFKNRLDVLRNLVDFVNGVLEKNQIRGNYDLTNFESQEEIPSEDSREYDIIVESIDSLNEIETITLVQAQLECFVNNGKIQGINITNPGYGYTLPPKVTISGDTAAAVEVEIDTLGRVVSTTIKNSGSSFVTAPILTVRPHAVIVRSDQDYPGKWSKYIYTYSVDNWAKIQTQSYNTTLYWEYIDWISSNYNSFKDFDFVLSDFGSMPLLEDVPVGAYLKIKNSGDGRYIILERVDSQGDFSLGYNILYNEKGTIKILDNIWNYPKSSFSYDNVTLDETWFDQAPDIELSKILYAIKNDIFIKDLKVNWNLFFFKAVRSALVEQKLLDWAFKTSYINVYNKVGNLNQRPIYKLDNDKYIEDYIKEVKPYRTKIRNYISSYSYPDSGGDLSNVYTTDFDLPPYYNSATQTVDVVNLGDSILVNQPWKDWADNYKYEIGSILIANPGKGYTQKPVVTITTSTGDTGTGASAEAYIKDGKVFKVIVTESGSGYTQAPIVTISGGGPYVSTTATLVATLENNQVRKNILGVKFDRVGVNTEIGSTATQDIFVCTGDRDSYVTTWPVSPDKKTIVPTLDGKLIFATDYTIDYYFEKYNGYSKQYSRFRFLNKIPTAGQILKIKYNKHISLYTAVDRIDKFYFPSDIMPGKELPLLMTGAEYPGRIIQGLPLSYSVPWSSGVNYDTTPWDDLINYYAKSKIVNTATIESTTITLDNTEGLSVGQIINVLNSSTLRVRTDTAITSINTLTGVIGLDCPTYGVKYAKATSTSTGSTITIKTKTDFYGDIKIGDTVFVSGMTTLGYNGKYTVNSINNNDVLEVISTGTLASIQGAASTTASIRVAIILETINVQNELLGYFWSTVTNTSSVLVQTFSKSNDVARVSVLVNGTSTSTYSLITDPLIADRAAVRVSILSTSSSTTVDVYLYGNPLVEFWKYDSNENSLDSIIQGGSYTASNFVGGLGVAPEDLIISGDAFLSENDSYAPEELVPGHVLDSLSVNVYTQQSPTNALMINGAFSVVAGVTTSFIISEIPEAVGGFMLHIGGRILDGIRGEYLIRGNQITIPAQSYSGRGGYTLLNVGSDPGVDGSIVFVENQTRAVVQSLSKISDIRLAYVLVDGQEIDRVNTTTEYGYIFEAVGPRNQRACVRVYNMPQGDHTVEAWFFESIYTNFNRISEERFSVTATQSTFVLSKKPGVLEPLSAQVIVEVDSGGIRQRLSPPWVSYYRFNGSTLTYSIDNKNQRPAGTFSDSNVQVFANGYKLRFNYDYTINSTTGVITLTAGLLTVGDAIAIMAVIDHDYLITDDTLELTTSIANAELKILSFTDHNDMMMRTERFQGTALREFHLSRPVMNDNYIWVSVNGRPLISRYDFLIQDDKQTVKINDRITVGPTDEVMVTTIDTSEFGGKILGFRIFKDMFEKTHYTRISKYHSTVLSQELLYTDTEIHVQDATELVPPNPARNKPGVVFIDAERIEFFSKEGNRLSQLRRSTLGTGPAFRGLPGAKVVDQSLQQSIPYVENNLVQRIYTAQTATYAISTLTSTSTGDGIVLTPGIDPIDQITVYYGGRQLRKSYVELHDKTVAYDTTANSIIILEPEFSVSTSTQELTLNIGEYITSGTQITVVQRKGYVWTGTESLITSGVNQARFIREKEAELPDIYYYGGDNVILDTDYDPFIDDSGDPLEDL